MILIASAVFPPEPVVSARLSFDLAESLTQNQRVVVVSPPPTRPHGMQFEIGDQSAESARFRHVVLDTYTCPESRTIGRLIESISFGLGLKRFIKENRNEIDVIYANVWPLFAQNLLVREASRHGIPVIMHVQDVYPEFMVSKLGRALGALLNSLLLPLDKNTLKQVDRVVVISEQMKKYLSVSRRIAGNKITVVRNWQNDSDFAKGKDSDADNDGIFRFLFLGSINPTANVELLIHAFGKSAIDNAELIIAGDGPNKEKCVNLAKSFGKKIRFIKVKPDEVPAIQSQADVLLLPLKKGVGGSSLPSKMTAYMFSAKPILASMDRESEAAQIILLNQCGVVVDPENEMALAEQMSVMAQAEPKWLKAQGANSLEFATQNLSRETNLSCLSEIIERASGK